jgi:glutamyl-tRNA reductase
MSTVLCIGISHHTAPVDLREQFSLSADQLDGALQHFIDRKESYAPLNELVILSTCNRFELYASIFEERWSTSTENYDTSIFALMGDLFECSPDFFQPHIYRYHDKEAVQHLSNVAAGLDSIAVGEHQILGQVSKALDAALHNHSTRHILSSMFRTAIHTGKRVRTETEIGHHPVTLSSIAIHLVEQATCPLNQQKVLVIGAGEMAEKTLEALQWRGVHSVTITNRTMERALQLAHQYGAFVVPVEQLPEVVSQSDLIFSCAAVSEPILNEQLIQNALKNRNGRSLALVDLGVPRNIDPQVKHLPEIYLFDMDHLQSFSKESISNRMNEIPKAQAIIREEVESFEKWLKVIPVVGKLHRKAEAIRQREVERTLRHLPEVDHEVENHIHHLSHALMRKLLHEPTLQLRKGSDQEDLQTYMKLVSDLFGLDHEMESEE